MCQKYFHLVEVRKFVAVVSFWQKREMSSEAKEKLLEDQPDQGRSNWQPRLLLIFGLCVTSCAALTAYLVFSDFYQQRLDIPPKLVDVPLWYFTRSHRLEKSTSDKEANEKALEKHHKDEEFPFTIDTDIIQKNSNHNAGKKLVCYYASPSTTDSRNLYPKSIDPHLCTHINIGVVSLIEHRLNIDHKLNKMLNETKSLKGKNKNLKVLLWVGGADSTGFPQMVENHANRKIFIRSLRDALKLYHLDGVDLDWEFPSAHKKERQHFSQLLYEIRKEYQREHRDYLLTVAVAAPEGIVYFAYDIRELNKYVDFVNIMTYDFHFYSKSTPFTGLNAPLYARHNEHSVLSTLNLNYTVKFWESQGLYRDKIVVGLPTFGHSFRDNYNWLRLCIFVAICISSSIAVYFTWSVIYQQSLNIPPKFTDIPIRYYNRAEIYSEKFYKSRPYSRDKSKFFKKLDFVSKNKTQEVRQIENERIYPSKYGNYIYKQDTGLKLVCYYEASASSELTNTLYLNNVDPHLCTHLNVGIVQIAESRLIIDDRMKRSLEETKLLKKKNKDLKVLLWVGGGTTSNFSEMVAQSSNRKIFIQSLVSVLEIYCLDGIDLDWEFPNSRKSERLHFSQLLHEIRREYQRDHRTYLLTVAVAAPERLIFSAYDVEAINSYTDFVNVMTFDYHFYTKTSTLTGLNAPLYAGVSEHTMLHNLNINYTVNIWLSEGLDKRKAVIGLPTYGHSFKLVNPFNNGIGAPAEDIGRVGTYGFATYSEICWFRQRNLYVTTIYDAETCSPYLYAGTEWISYEDERSLECKAQYIKSNGFGGAMIFSLNTDDYGSHCNLNLTENPNDKNSTFPLVRKIYSVLFDRESDTNF